VAHPFEPEIRALYESLAAEFPAVPRCLSVYAEPNGDWGVGHWLSNADGCAQLTFDTDSRPLDWSIAHELGHALHAAAGGDPRAMFLDDPVLSRYWPFRGFEPLATTIARATYEPFWGYFPGELFADEFAAVVLGVRLLNTRTWAAAIMDHERPAIRAWFAAPKGDGMADVTQKQLEAYKRALQQQLDAETVRINNELALINADIDAMKVKYDPLVPKVAGLQDIVTRILNALARAANYLNNI